MKHFLPIGWLLISANFPWMVVAEEDKKPRPFFEYKGNYRKDINDQKDKFRKVYGYELLDLDAAWRLDEIELMSKAFAQLPLSLHRLPELKAFYRLSHISSTREGLPVELVPAATFPAYSPVFRHKSQSHNIYLEDNFFRIEFYNPLFFENESEAINIIHHEMAHALDISRGLISVSKTWLEISHFKVLNLPALDQRKEADFLFTFINQSDVDRYAPVSTRHGGTYSRLSPQEDFANSIAAYIHYPYFRLSNPKRYQYLKKNIFYEKEYFPQGEDQNDFETFVLADLKRVYEKKNWKQIEEIFKEISRGFYPKAVIGASTFLLDHLIELPLEAVDSLVEASCFLMHPNAVKFRRGLVRQEKISVKQVLRKRRCLMTGRDSFERVLSKRPIKNLYFFREESQYYIQFLDSEEPLAFTRGYVTQYRWELQLVEGSKKLLAKGQVSFSSSENGSFRFNLQKSAEGKFKIPTGQKLLLRVKVRRRHPRNFKIFDGDPTEIQFVVYPWFDYLTDPPPKIRAIYPLNLLSLSPERPS